MTRRYLFLLLPPALLLLAGCTARENDALAREKASMDAEAKALATHKPKTQPGPVMEHDPVTGSGKAAPRAGTRLPAGTPVRIATTQSLSTRSAATGDEWTGTLLQDLKDSTGKVLANAGSEIKGRIVLASDGSNLRRKHELEIRVYRLKAASGESVDVRTTSFIREGGEGGKKPAIVESQEKIDFQLASETTFP